MPVRLPFRFFSPRRISSLLPAGLPRWFIALGLVLGASYALLMGPLNVPDEPGHMYRAYLVSEGFCTGVPAIGAPVDRREFDHRANWIQLPPKSTGHDLLSLVDDAQGRPLSVVSLFYAVNLYSCIPYLPAGAALRFGRIFTGSPLSLMYMGRFANLLFYLLMVVAAMRLLPQFQVPLAVLALMPMSLHQAASLSADAVTMAVAFVLIAYVIRLALTDQPALLQRSDYLVLAAAAVIAGLCKSSAGLLFVLLLIPGVRFPSRRTRWLAISGIIALGFITTAAWQYINRPNGEVHATLKRASGVDLAGNAAYIWQQPDVFLSSVIRTSQALDEEYLEEFVGKLGPLVIRLPVWIPWVYLALLLVLAAVYHAGPRLFRWQRILLVGIFLLNVASLFVVVWTTEIKQTELINDFAKGRGLIAGLQGRYLIPFAPLLLIAVSDLIRSRKAIQVRDRWIAAPALAIVVIVNVVALELVWNRYEAHSSTFPNQLRMALHLQFADTPETAASRYDNLVIASRASRDTPFMVAAGARHAIPDPMSITTKGYMWPDDILLVSDQDIAGIPLGAPLPRLNVDYEGKLVRRPGSSVEDSRVYLVRDGQKHWVWDGHWITVHGYKWPDDINVISASSLAQIPEGDPVH